MKRRVFTDFSGCEAAEIILNPDGSLTIETEAEYGDSDSGWGAAYAYINMTPAQVKSFREFLK